MGNRLSFSNYVLLRKISGSLVSRLLSHPMNGPKLALSSVHRLDPVSQDISEPDESEPFRFILALVAGFFGTIPINLDPSGRIFRNHQDISEPTIRSSALMNFLLHDFF